jgi:hypothetical protein
LSYEELFDEHTQRDNQQALGAGLS